MAKVGCDIWEKWVGGREKKKKYHARRLRDDLRPVAAVRVRVAAGLGGERLDERRAAEDCPAEDREHRCGHGGHDVFEAFDKKM